MKIHVNNGNGNSNHKSRKKERQTFEQEVRRSRVIGLHSRGMTQTEIAHELNVDQSTISDDICYIRNDAKNKIIEFKDNLSFEFMIKSKIYFLIWDAVSIKKFFPFIRYR